MGTDCVFGKEGKLGQVSRDGITLIKSLSGTKDHNLTQTDRMSL